LAPYYDNASLVIAHGGLATTMEVLARGLPLVSVSNPDRYDHHQDDLLSAMEKEGYLVWCKHLSELKQAIAAARQGCLKTYQRGECKIHLHIHKFLSASGSSR
jgi:UDP-N-acetylglucosamine:LPS N-acetylglucosamine transferase